MDIDTEIDKVQGRLIRLISIDKLRSSDTFNVLIDELFNSKINNTLTSMLEAKDRDSYDSLAGILFSLQEAKSLVLADLRIPLVEDELRELKESSREINK
jgi:hypothetical protein